MKTIDKLTKKDLQMLQSMYNKVWKMYDKFSNNDYELKSEFSTISEQLNIACGAFEQIFQDIE